MCLTFLTPLMLAGAVLVAAPIILHLMMRQQPKHLMFPALRFIRQRNDANKRRLKLRHLLLLALRCAVIVLSGAGAVAAQFAIGRFSGRSGSAGGGGAGVRYFAADAVSVSKSNSAARWRRKLPSG